MSSNPAPAPITPADEQRVLDSDQNVVVFRSCVLSS